MNGPIIMAAFLAVVALLGGAAFVVTRMLPPQSAVRLAADKFIDWAKKNPRLFEKRLKNFAFGLLCLVFLVLTLVYS